MLPLRGAEGDEAISNQNKFFEIIIKRHTLMVVNR